MLGLDVGSMNFSPTPEVPMGELIKFPTDRVSRTTGHTKKNQKAASILVFEGIQYASKKEPADFTVATTGAKPHSGA